MSGIACILTGGPEYRIAVNGRTYLFEWNWYAGPTAISKTGRVLESQPSRFLAAATLWNAQGRRIDERGLCVWEPEPEPRVVEIVKGFRMALPDGREPDEYRGEILARYTKERTSTQDNRGTDK